MNEINGRVVGKCSPGDGSIMWFVLFKQFFGCASCRFVRAFSSSGKQGLPCCGMQASAVVALVGLRAWVQQLWHMGLVTPWHGNLSRLEIKALSSLHSWQADSYSLRHQGSPSIHLF